mgnify:CR=1 FL=1
MIKKEDIERAILLFREWDLKKTWDQPTTVFINHLLQKSENALKTAQYILKIMEDTKIKELFDAQEYDGTLWVINPSYYRIFFLAQYLLAIDGKKLPQNTKDTHKTIELAFLYYFIVKGSGVEGKKNISWDDITQSKLSRALELLSEANEEVHELTQQRAKSMVEYLDSERIKRQEFTYALTINAELAKAKTSLQRAIEFGDIVKEYMKAVKMR